ncbi:polysaccharide pyruvyl transferase family protein [Vibrio cholerae]|uniref:polysaccharide pyruvyl transferase family protein n=1 Tax=Vibrio cholerae TaxID=666 RepID=UPI001C2F6F3E|nr:polysaccharide pyruvyl transferase family protein [Vibrio cholerae]
MNENNGIGLLDTTISTMNVGDRIIYDSCSNEIGKTFSTEQFFNLSTRDYLSPFSINILNKTKYNFLMGTNILSNDNLFRGPWKLTPLHLPFIKKNNIVTLGVGWNSYQKDPSMYAKIFYSRLLSKDIWHSVRDGYTANMLKKSGINNVLNTSCATMWKLTEQHCKDINCDKKDNVIFTLTDYNRDIEKDALMIELLMQEYKNVYYWLQGSEDLNYIKQFGKKVTENIKIVPPRLDSYDSILESIDIDFIGTRLHAGIRALQKKRRAIIIGIDNRATEKSKDFGINVIPRENLYRDLKREIFNNREVRIKLPLKEIEKWQEQFS